MHQNPFSAGSLPWTPVVRFVFGWGELKYPYYGYYISPKEAEARQTCPGFFLKSFLEPPGNLLIKFVDTLLSFALHAQPLDCLITSEMKS